MLARSGSGAGNYSHNVPKMGSGREGTGTISRADDALPAICFRQILEAANC